MTILLWIWCWCILVNTHGYVRGIHHRLSNEKQSFVKQTQHDHDHHDDDDDDDGFLTIHMIPNPKGGKWTATTKWNAAYQNWWGPYLDHRRKTYPSFDGSTWYPAMTPGARGGEGYGYTKLGDYRGIHPAPPHWDLTSYTGVGPTVAMEPPNRRAIKLPSTLPVKQVTHVKNTPWIWQSTGRQDVDSQQLYAYARVPPGSVAKVTGGGAPKAPAAPPPAKGKAQAKGPPQMMGVKPFQGLRFL